MGSYSFAWVVCLWVVVPSISWAESPCNTPPYAQRIVQEFDADILRMTQDQLAYDKSTEADIRRTADHLQAIGKLTAPLRVREIERVVASGEFQSAGASKETVLHLYDVSVRDAGRFRAAGNIAAACEAGIAAKTYLQLARSFSVVQYQLLKSRLSEIEEVRPVSP